MGANGTKHPLDYLQMEEKLQEYDVNELGVSHASVLEFLDINESTFEGWKQGDKRKIVIKRFMQTLKTIGLRKYEKINPDKFYPWYYDRKWKSEFNTVVKQEIDINTNIPINIKIEPPRKDDK